jgi:hypothetical protein
MCGQLLALVLGCVSAATAIAEGTVFYSGTVGKGNQITLELVTEDHDHCHGQYRYNRIGKTLSLEGTCDGSGRLVLHEYVTDNKETGTFRGQLQEKTGTSSGRWTSADDTRELAFDLQRVAKTATMTRKVPDNYEVATQYLVFDGQAPHIQALNTYLRNDAEKMIKQMAADYGRHEQAVNHFKGSFAEAKVSLVYRDSNLVSLLYSEYSYTGGAHGNFSYRAQTLYWDGSTLHEMQPADVIEPRAWDAVSKLCAEDLHRQGASEYYRERFGTTRQPVMNIMAAGLLITFEPYEVGCYAEGEWTVLIPYRDVTACLKPGTAVAKLAKQE